jgi:hypothetical protein
LCAFYRIHFTPTLTPNPSGMTPYRRQKSMPIQGDVFRVGAKVTSEQGLKLSSVAPAEIAAQIASMFETARTPIRLHGTRVEEMFTYAIAAVGSVKAIKREETDDLVVAVPEPLVVPDFRVVLADGTDILVEVKNFHDKDAWAAPRITHDYLRGLISYGELFARRVFLAVYWSAWRRWTLHNAADLLALLERGGLTFSLAEAYRVSEMRLLGDALLGTRYPLLLRFGVTSELKERRGSESEYVLRIDSVEMTVAGKPVRNKRDQRIAFGLMMHGGWEETEHLEMDGDRILAIGYSYSPHEEQPDVGFAPVAALSSLASSEFNDLTADSEDVDRLRPQHLPSPPYPRVGEGYHGVDLPLWIMVIQPDRSLLSGTTAREPTSAGSTDEG